MIVSNEHCRNVRMRLECIGNIPVVNFEVESFYAVAVNFVSGLVCSGNLCLCVL